MAAYRRVATFEQSDEAAPVSGPVAATRSRAGSHVDGATSSEPAEVSAGGGDARSRSERISDKLHALAWVVVAYAVASYTQLVGTVLSDERILRPVLHVSIALFSANGVLMLYLTVYLPFKFPTSAIHKTSAASPAFWEAYCPRVIPSMTVFGVVGSFLLVRACYPVWGFLTPLILGVVMLGMFFSLQFIPWC